MLKRHEAHSLKLRQLYDLLWYELPSYLPTTLLAWSLGASHQHKKLALLAAFATKQPYNYLLPNGK